MSPIPQDGAADIQAYNDELESLGTMSWHNSPWLYTECYLYRRIQTCFARRATRFWKCYDVFGRQKARALTSSKASVVELLQFLRGAIDTDERHASALLQEMLEISLWGNSVDLLLLVHLSAEELQGRQGKQARESFKQNVVDDDTEEVCNFVSGLKDATRTREIHVVLDNAGFEFFADLILVVYLLATNYASVVVLHGKAFPWFVSDVTEGDVAFTLEALANAAFSGDVSEAEAAEMTHFGATLAKLLEAGQLRYESHPFWTTQHCFARMREEAPDLWASLVSSELVIFKGDLNYRKLVFDGLWP